MPAVGDRRRLPIPRRPQALIVVPSLLCGVAGTGLLYSAATGGGLLDLLIGIPLFAIGLWAAGWPFVLSMTLLSEARRSANSAHRPKGSGAARR